MTRFAVVRDIDALPDLIEGLAAWTRARSRLGAPPAPLAGIWIEHPAEAALSCRASARLLDGGPARLRLQLGPGRWMLCLTEAVVSPATLMTELKAASGVRGSTRARFAPVYGAAVPPAAWARQWLDLAGRYPGLVMPPLLCDDAGHLTFTDPTPVSLQAIAVARRGA